MIRRARPFSTVDALGSWVGLVLVGVLVAAGPAAAADQGDVLRLRAARLVHEGRCAEAEPLLARIAADSSAAGGAAMLRGQCAMREQRWADAVQGLEAAERAGEGSPRLVLELAIAHFHAGDFAAARATLERSRSKASGDPVFQLYDGLLTLQEAQAAEAAELLAGARSVGPDTVDPVASYYEGLAWAAARDRERAEAALDRARRAHPDSVWATEAERVLRDLTATPERRRWLNARFGFEYDDNVVLLADGVRLPDEIGGGHDVRGTLRLNGGYEWFRTADWSSGATLTHYSEFHQDLEDFNLQQPIVSLWLDRRLGTGLIARSELAAGYAWVGGSEPFLFSSSGTLSLYKDWESEQQTRWTASFYRYDYLFPPSLDDPGTPGSEAQARNRDGQGVSAGFDHVFGLGPFETIVTAGYRYHRYSARGSEYSYQGHEALLGTRTPLPYDLRLETWLSYTYKPFRNASTFPDPRSGLVRNERRSDDVERYEAALIRPLSDHVTASVRYTYLRNHSNVAVFDYDREILGAYFTVHGRP